MIYEINIKADRQVAGKFAKWLPEHVKKVLACPGFITAHWFKTDEPEATRVPWTVQYEVESETALENYLKEASTQSSPRIFEEAKKEFGDQIAISSRALKKISEFSSVFSDESRQLSDYPKLHCPFIRQNFKVKYEDWKKMGSKFELKTPEAYLVINQVNPGYEWVFEDSDTFACEKLDGTNVKILTKSGRLIVIQNRLNIIDPLQVMKGNTYITEAIFQSIGKDYVKETGEQAGEVIGPKLQGNPYKLDVHLWYPFEKAITDLRYRSFDEHDRNFDNWSSWFKDHLFSRFFSKRAARLGTDEKVFAEGVVFYNLKRKSESKTWMAKLRRDMFLWFYDGIEIIGYDKAGVIK